MNSGSMAEHARIAALDGPSLYDSRKRLESAVYRTVVHGEPFDIVGDELSQLQKEFQHPTQDINCRGTYNYGPLATSALAGFKKAMHSATYAGDLDQSERLTELSKLLERGGEDLSEDEPMVFGDKNFALILYSDELSERAACNGSADRLFSTKPVRNEAKVKNSPLSSNIEDKQASYYFCADCPVMGECAAINFLIPTRNSFGGGLVPADYRMIFKHWIPFSSFDGLWEDAQVMPRFIDYARTLVEEEVRPSLRDEITKLKFQKMKNSEGLSTKETLAEQARIAELPAPTAIRSKRIASVGKSLIKFFENENITIKTKDEAEATEDTAA